MDFPSHNYFLSLSISVREPVAYSVQKKINEHSDSVKALSYYCIFFLTYMTYTQIGIVCTNESLAMKLDNCLRMCITLFIFECNALRKINCGGIYASMHTHQMDEISQFIR